MADAVAKFLAKVTKAEKVLLIALVTKIVAGDMKGLAVKKLVGSTDIFRVRKGNFRIVYRQTSTDCLIIAIDRRSEKTYRNF